LSKPEQEWYEETMDESACPEPQASEMCKPTEMPQPDQAQSKPAVPWEPNEISSPDEPCFILLPVDNLVSNFAVELP
jgi:hypothetical protein